MDGLHCHLKRSSSPTPTLLGPLCNSACNKVQQGARGPGRARHSFARYWHCDSWNKGCEGGEEGTPWSQYITTLFSIKPMPLLYPPLPKHTPPPPPPSSPLITIPQSETPSCISSGFNLRRVALSEQTRPECQTDGRARLI